MLKYNMHTNNAFEILDGQTPIMYSYMCTKTPRHNLQIRTHIIAQNKNTPLKQNNVNKNLFK